MYYQSIGRQHGHLCQSNLQKANIPRSKCRVYKQLIRIKQHYWFLNDTLIITLALNVTVASISLYQLPL